MRLLLVEDEIEIQGFLKRSLTEAGYQVQVAGDARTAARLASEDQHDVLIVDLGLPSGRYHPDSSASTDGGNRSRTHSFCAALRGRSGARPGTGRRRLSHEAIRSGRVARKAP